MTTETVNTGFMECEPCSKKAGSPTLCKSCLFNCEQISNLGGEVATLQEKLEIITKVADL